jgi:uncharacterized cupredoxin-like copper-binding protein
MIHPRPLLAALCLLALTQKVAAQPGHRMGGIPDMPPDMLKQDDEEDHHSRHHGDPPDVPHEFAFGRRLPSYDVDVKRIIDIDLRDGAWSGPRPIRVKVGDILRFELHNVGSLAHEFRLGDPAYQREHALMLERMRGVRHADSNAITLAPGKTRSIVWQFGSEPVVQLACHEPGHYQSGEVLTVIVEP